MKRIAVLLLLANSWSCKDDPEPVPLCMADTDCRMGERCAADGRCIVGECVRDEECEDPRRFCATDFTCQYRDGFGDECDPSRPCPFGQFCSSLLGLCLDASSSADCVRRAQCPANQICDRDANKCVPDTGCYGDAFCETGEVCDLVNHTCRVLAVECTSCILGNECPGGTRCFLETKECLVSSTDAACRSGESCDPLGRCVQCTTSEQCGPGLFCNVATGRCDSNVQCVDDVNQCPTSSEVTCVECTLPETCDPRTRRCQAPAMVCDEDLDCPGDQFCDLTLDPPVCVRRLPDCLNDLLDDPSNNSLATATLLPAGAGPLYDELKLCQQDQDWYRLELQAGTYVTIDARFRAADGDIDLQLFLEDGRTLLDESRSVTDNERVELAVGTDLTVLVRVFLAVPTVAEVPYRLIVARDPGDVCPDDSHEPDDAPSNAKQLIPDVPYEGRICSADPDWLVLRNVPLGSQIRARLDFVHVLGDLNLELYRAGGTAPLATSASATDLESIVYDASYGGDYYLRIVGRSTDANVYTVRAEVRPGVVRCADDSLESNDTPLTATATGGLTMYPANLSLCAGDEDWFRVHLRAGDAVTADIGFEANADLELKLYPGNITSRSASPLRASNGTNRREWVAFRSFTTSDYLVRVHGHNAQVASPYQLRLKVEPPFLCQPDPVDVQGRGNDRPTAFDFGLPPVHRDDLTLCFGDQDWYRLFVQGGFVNVLKLSYLQQDAILDFELYDQGGAQLFTTAGQPPSDSREVQINVPGFGFGVIFVRVVNGGGFESPYHLSLDLIPIFSCNPDRAEFNDTRPLASAVASSTISPIQVDNLSLCASVRSPANVGDEDWFELKPPVAGARVRANIEFTQGDLSLELFSPNGGPRACRNEGANRCYSDGFGLSETVTFTATTTDSYFLKVGSVYSAASVPIRPPDADTPYRLRVEYELP